MTIGTGDKIELHKKMLQIQREMSPQLCYVRDLGVERHFLLQSIRDVSFRERTKKKVLKSFKVMKRFPLKSSWENNI